jgi:hypothetical protein
MSDAADEGETAGRKYLVFELRIVREIQSEPFSLY